MNNKDIDRRQFVQVGAALGLASKALSARAVRAASGRVIGANDRINIGAIGVGDPATHLVDDVDADEDADLAPEVAPTFGQPGGNAVKGSRHGDRRL